MHMQLGVQHSLEQAQHSAEHQQNQQAAVFALRTRVVGSAASDAGEHLPLTSAVLQSDADQSSGELRESQDIRSWQHAVQTALQSALDLFDADRTVRRPGSHEDPVVSRRTLPSVACPT